MLSQYFLGVLIGFIIPSIIFIAAVICFYLLREEI